MVYNTALGFCHDTGKAEDITQDVFVKVFRSGHTFEGGSSVKTWIYRITINTAISHSKKKQLSVVQPDASTGLVEYDHPGVLLHKKEEAAILAAAIDDLPPQQKTAFVLSYIEDTPRQEVADIMETSLKAVESLLQRAKANLRATLKNRYPNRRKG